jgi:CRISPR-associated protein (TIGR02710 family)
LIACRALIATVGLSEAPVEFSARIFKPEIVCLVCTNESLRNANELKNKFDKSVDCKIHVVTNGTEPSQIMKQVYRIFENLSSRGFEKRSIIVDGTGGTKPMSAGAMIAAATLGLSNIYVEVKRDQTGKVLPETMRVYELPDPREVLTEYYADVGIEQLNRCEFASAKSVFGRLREENSNFTRKKLLEALTLLSEAFDASDKFDHKNALPKLDEAIESLRDYLRESRVDASEKLLSQLLTFRDGIQEVARPEANVEKVFDIFVNAKRRLSLGRYDDAVARLYRTLEALAHSALQADCGFDTREIAENKLSLDKSYQELLRLGHPLGRKYEEDGGPRNETSRFRGMLEARNNSILAHGWRPIPAETARKFATFVEGYIKLYCEVKKIDSANALQRYEYPTVPAIRSLLYT